MHTKPDKTGQMPVKSKHIFKEEEEGEKEEEEEEEEPM